MCGVWIALEDVEAGAGPLMYKPGSHLLPVVDMKDVGVNRLTPTVDDYVQLYVPRFDEILAAQDLPTRRLFIKKGQAFVWASNLAHGGAPIEREGSTRRSLVVHQYFKGCGYYTPMLSDTDGLRPELRLPRNITTRLWEWPMENGRPTALSLALVHGSVRLALRRAPSLL
jgi:ectoine hydroxylase-related dioxygenase (phytanoyl-CoA dioxygenase family)